MQLQQRGESFVWIVIGVFILSFVILWIANLLTFSVTTSTEYDDANRIFILKQNLTNIVKNIDTSGLKENEIFYIHKNSSTPPKTYEVLTGSINEQYRYIDEHWNNIPDLENYEWNIYSQILWITREDISLNNQNQIIKVSITKMKRK